MAKTLVTQGELNTPFEDPTDKVADLWKDGYTKEEAIFHTENAFKRKLSTEELDEINSWD